MIRFTATIVSSYVVLYTSPNAPTNGILDVLTLLSSKKTELGSILLLFASLNKSRRVFCWIAVSELLSTIYSLYEKESKYVRIFDTYR